MERFSLHSMTLSIVAVSIRGGAPRRWEKKTMLKTWMTGVAALTLTMAATAVGAAPIRSGTAVGALVSQVEAVQFFESYDEDYDRPAPVYRPRERLYREPPVQEYYARRPIYREPPVEEYYARRPVYRAPNQQFYDKEAAKDYVKSYRRAQKEIFKEQVRGWNRAHGY
jgi:hypothetical protein